MCIVYGENFFFFQRHMKIVEVEIHGAAIYRKRYRNQTPALTNGSPFSEVTYPLSLKSLKRFGLPNGTKQQFLRVPMMEFLYLSVYHFVFSCVLIALVFKQNKNNLCYRCS